MKYYVTTVGVPWISFMFLWTYYYFFICAFFQASWEQKLIDRVYNVEKGCRKRASDASTQSTRKKRKGLDRYPPVTHLSDEATYHRNAAALDKELEKVKPRKEILLELMRVTFPQRRQQILSDDYGSVQEVMVNYPAFSYPEIVSKCIYAWMWNK